MNVVIKPESSPAFLLIACRIFCAAFLLMIHILRESDKRQRYPFFIWHVWCSSNKENHSSNSVQFNAIEFDSV